MKSVSFSEIVYANDIVRWPAARSMFRLATFALLMVLGLAALVALFQRFAPGAPRAFILVPVLAGGALPLFLFMPARFEVTTRFEARHLVRNLDDGLASLGYERIPGRLDTLRYQPRAARWMRWPTREIAVVVRPHVIDIAGPAMSLRVLQKALAR